MRIGETARVLGLDRRTVAKMADAGTLKALQPTKLARLPKRGKAGGEAHRFFRRDEVLRLAGIVEKA